MQLSDRMRLLGRASQQSLAGAYEEPRGDTGAISTSGPHEAAVEDFIVDEMPLTAPRPHLSPEGVQALHAERDRGIGGRAYACL